MEEYEGVVGSAVHINRVYVVHNIPVSAVTEPKYKGFVRPLSDVDRLVDEVDTGALVVE